MRGLSLLSLIHLYYLQCPDSQIISFDKDSRLEITYEESMPYEITSLFLNNKSKFSLIYLLNKSVIRNAYAIYMTRRI